MSNHAKKLYLDIIHIFLWGGSYLNFLVKTKKCIHLACIWIEFHLIYSTYACENIAHTYIHTLYNVIWILHASSLWKKKSRSHYYQAQDCSNRRLLPWYKIISCNTSNTPQKNTLFHSNKRWLDSKPCLDAFFSIWTLSVCL